MKLPLAAAVCLACSQALFGQPAMPAWLAPYPGATAQTKTYPALVDATYNTDASPGAVAEHYRKLFEAQDLEFHPNSDGIGSVVRAPVAECNLLIAIHPQGYGTSVRVSCAAKDRSSAAISPVVHSSSAPGIPAGVMERHRQLVAEMGIHRTYSDAPAPPLVWPEWLVPINGGRLSTRAGVDYAGNAMLRANYTTSEPMTALFAFYKDLLTAHEYPVHSGSMSTGRTQKGVLQNANGQVEGSNYPNGFPGPSTVIYVGLSRTYLNQPITVDLRFTTYAYKAPQK